MPIDASKVQWDTPKIDASQVKWDEPPSVGSQVKQQVGNLVAGAVRGAGSIGATLMTPIDAAARAVGVQNDFIGRTDRRGAMDEALQGLGADPSSVAFKGGKLGAEIAGTLGAGGALAAPLRGAAPALAEAIRTAGMSAGGSGGANLLLRALGGATTGAASAGLVDPQSAMSGALVGAALPPSLMAAGKAGNALGRLITGPQVPDNLLAGVQAAREAGYVIPPSQAKPSLINRVMEGTAGKLTTAQNASARNQEVSNTLVKKALGLPEDAPLTIDALKSVRQQAGSAYEAVRGAGTVTADKQLLGQLDSIVASSSGAERSFPGLAKNDVADVIKTLKQPSFDAGDAVDAIRVLRDAADTAFGKGDKAASRAYRSASGAMEDALERHLSSTGDDGALQAFRDARTLIAKTYSAEKAINPASGNVDASKLAGMLKRDKPLSGELRTVAEFASQFPKASQTVERMGSLPQTSPLDWGLASGLSLATANPLMLATAVARPALRATALSPMVQNRLAASSTPNALAALLSEPVTQLGYRAAPLGLSSR